MEQLASGAYSTAYVHDRLVLKLVQPGLSQPSATQRCIAVRRYYERLMQAGVNVPRTKVLTMNQYLVIVMDRVPGENSLQTALKLRSADDEVELCELFDSCFTQGNRASKSRIDY